jgi:hypothetical protein
VNASLAFRFALCSLAVAFETANAAAQPAPSPDTSVLDGVVAVDRPATSFVPKYQPELFVGGGYSGSFTSGARQWPTLVLSPLEGLLLRPGRFDLGAYSELRLGRPDEQFGRFEVGFGLEAMWRFLETSLSDWAAVIRAAYLVDTSHPGTPLVRTGVGAQVSLVRSLALQLTYDQLVSPTQDFSNGQELLHGLSVTIKVGLCPIADFCHQLPQRPIDKLDRSPVTCHQAALTCQAAEHAPAGTHAGLCAAAVRALDTTRHPASWTAPPAESQALDPVGAFLRALRSELTMQVVASIDPALSRLDASHAASLRGLTDYAERQRNLESGQMLSKSYTYLVTPVMVRDWLGCAANGAPIACATDAICERDTGAAP